MSDPKWPYALRIVHLQGGLCAISPPESQTVEIFASASLSNDPLIALSLQSYGELYYLLEEIELNPLGVEFYTDRRQQEGLEPSERRHFFRDSERIWHVEEAAQTWSQIAHTAVESSGDIRMMDLCRRIDFELRAASHKWFDISWSYGRILSALTKEGVFEEGVRLDNLFSFELYLSIHSFFSEIATLRDYFAEFVANYILVKELAKERGLYISKMSRLAIEFRKEPAISHPLADIIRLATSKDEKGWLNTLSAYRDLLLHHTPVSHPRGRSFVIQQSVKTRDGVSLPAIAFHLPDDPEVLKKERAGGGPLETLDEFIASSMKFEPNMDLESLRYCHHVLGKMALLSQEIAKFSPVPPTMPHITEKDILSVKGR